MCIRYKKLSVLLKRYRLHLNISLGQNLSFDLMMLIFHVVKTHARSFKAATTHRRADKFSGHFTSSSSSVFLFLHDMMSLIISTCSQTTQVIKTRFYNFCKKKTIKKGNLLLSCSPLVGFYLIISCFLLQILLMFLISFVLT